MDYSDVNKRGFKRYFILAIATLLPILGLIHYFSLYPKVGLVIVKNYENVFFLIFGGVIGFFISCG